MTNAEKLDLILEILERLEARQLEGLKEIKETAPAVLGSFASPTEQHES